MTCTPLRALAILLLASGLAPCLAADPTVGILACRAIPQSAARLACFDRESARLSASLASAHQAHASVAPQRAAAASHPSLDPRQTFGLAQGAIDAREVSAGVRAPPVARISAHVAGISEAADGRLVFTLDNGQVWMELLQDHDLLAQAGQTATISRQLFGSYWLRLQSGRGCKVTRVR